MNILEVKGLTKKYGDFTAVDNLDFFVVEGEIFGFLSPNGARKTTTINMLTGLARVTSGSLTRRKGEAASPSIWPCRSWKEAF